MKIISNRLMIDKIKSNFKKVKQKIVERKNKAKNKTETKLELKYYALLISMVVVGIISLILNIQSNAKINIEDYYTYNPQEENKKSKEVNATNINSENVEYKQSISSISTSIPNIKKEEIKNNNENPYKYVYKYNYIMPVEGKIIREFSIDKVVYLKTIDMWKIHEGIDISANIGDKIVAVEKGVIKNISETEFYGVTIEIDHGNSYISKYSNLNKEIEVKIGDKVKKGQEIGAVGSTAKGESEDESHLHFEIMKNSEYINPEILGIK